MSGPSAWSAAGIYFRNKPREYSRYVPCPGRPRSSAATGCGTTERRPWGSRRGRIGRKWRRPRRGQWRRPQGARRCEGKEHALAAAAVGSTADQPAAAAASIQAGIPGAAGAVAAAQQAQQQAAAQANSLVVEECPDHGPHSVVHAVRGVGGVVGLGAAGVERGLRWRGQRLA